MRQFGTGSRIAIAWAMVAVGLLAGCRSSGIDPSGQHVFSRSPWDAPREYEPYPGGALAWDNVRVAVTPSRCVAPVGSDVVLLAGVVGPDNYLRTNERVDWMLSPGSPGELVDFGRGGWIDLLLGDFTRPRKISNDWVITSTSRHYLQLNRETATPIDDVRVLRGQSWVTVNSAVEGSSYVTAYAPSVYGWGAKRQTATIHWVDAEWRFPAPAIGPAGGRHVLTTTVTRHTDKSPRAGWTVRYDIVGGPPAGFGPEGSPSVEVVTDPCGAASAEIVQRESAAGTNCVNIQIIRPATIDGAGGKALAVGSGSTTVTWSAPGLSIEKTGPEVGSVGATLSYQITVTNSGDMPAEGVAVFDEIPTGFDLIRSNPPAEAAAGRLQWSIGRLEARQSRLFEVDLRATRAGSVSTCAEVTSAAGLRARDCVTTAIGAASLRVRIAGPPTAALGSEVRFDIIVENLGEVAATGLLVKDRFDEGLQHAVAKSPIEKELPDLPPGQPHQFKVVFRAVRPGNLRHEVEVTGDGGLAARAEASVEVAAGAAGAVAPSPTSGAAGTVAPSPTPPATTVGRPSVAVEKSGPPAADVGQTAEFVIRVRNTGDVALTKVKVVDSYDLQLLPVFAAEGFQRGDRSLTWSIESLPIGAVSLFRVQCRCTGAAASTANRASVTTAEGAKASGEARLEIRGSGQPSLPTQPTTTAAPGLAMEVTDWGDQVAVGRMLTYEIVVTNTSTVADEDVVLEADVPAQLQPVDADIQGPPGTGHAVQGQTVRFDPVRGLRPRGELRYEVRVKAVEPGKMRFRARLKSKHVTEELRHEEETEILGAS